MHGVAQRAREIHARAVVVDGHSDIPTDVWLRRMDGERRVLDTRHAERLGRGGVDVQLFGIYVEARMKPARSLEVALRQVEAFLEDLAESLAFMLVRSGSDLSRAVKEKKIATLLVLEGAEPVEAGIELLHLFYRLGIRVLGLTWNQRNLLADGIGEAQTGGGLTRYGREVVAEAAKLGMILDVSHMAPAGVRDVLALADRPVIASHSGACAVFEHARNLSDELIVGIARAGGVIGAPAFPKIIGPPVPTVETVVDHIEHMVRVAGEEHVGVGADFVDMFADLVARGRMGGEWIVPADEETRELSRVEDMPNLTEAMLKRGFSEGVIAGVLGGNFLRVLQRWLPQG